MKLTKVFPFLALCLSLCLPAHASIKQTYISSNPTITLNNTTTQYMAIDGQLNLSATEVNKYHYLRSNGGTFSDLTVYISANTLSANGTFDARKNGAGGLNQTLTITAGVTGIFSTTSTDSFSTNDAVNYRWNSAGGTGSASLEFASMTFAPSSNFRMYGVEQGAISLTSGNDYRHMIGNSTSATETDVQMKFRQGGTGQYGDVYLTANTSVTNTVLTSRINGANGNIVLTCTALTTGLFSSAGTDTIASNDLYNWKITGYTAASTVTATFYDVEFLSSDSSVNQYGGATNLSIADGTTRYFAFSGSFGARTSEVLVQAPINYNYTANNLEIYVPTNTTTSNSTFDIRVGGASSSLSVTITAGTTGYFSNTGTTITGASGDLVNLMALNGGGGSFLFRSVGFTMGETQASTGYAHSFSMIF